MMYQDDPRTASTQAIVEVVRTTWAEAMHAKLRQMGHYDYSSCDLPGCWHNDDPVLVDVARAVWREHGLPPPREHRGRGLTREIKAAPVHLSRSGITGKPRWAGLVKP